MTPRQAADICNIDRRTLLKHAREGRLPVAYQLADQRNGRPGTTLFTRAAVERFAKELSQSESAA